LSRPKKKSGLKQEKKNGGNNDSRKRNQGWIHGTRDRQVANLSEIGNINKCYIKIPNKNEATIISRGKNFRWLKNVIDNLLLNSRAGKNIGKGRKLSPTKRSQKVLPKVHLPRNIKIDIT
jgi:hypothetical protein